MLNINSKLEHKVSPTVALGQKVREMKAKGENLINMSIGENRFPAPQELIDSLKKYSNQVTYSDPQGILELRKAVSKYYQDKKKQVDEKNIIISPGSKAGIFILLMALEGDVMLIRPSWVSYEPQARHTGKKVFWIDTKFENNYFPTIRELKYAYKTAKEQGLNPKIIVLNYPNNPTSYIPDEKELKDIVLTCKELGLTIISDELYLELCYDSEKAISPSKFYSEGTIVIGGISKFLSVAGLRIGWVVTPQTEEGEKLASILKAFASDIWSNVSTSIQYAVAEYLENADYKKFIKENKYLHQLRNEYIFNELKKIGIDAVEPRGGFYVYVNMGRQREKLKEMGINNGLELQDYLLTKHKIACLSGVNFGEKPESLTLRLSTSFLDCNDSYQAEMLWEEYTNKSTLNISIQQEINELINQLMWVR